MLLADWGGGHLAERDEGLGEELVPWLVCLLGKEQSKVRVSYLSGNF